LNFEANPRYHKGGTSLCSAIFGWIAQAR